MRSLECVVGAPQVGLSGGAGRLRKASRRRRLQELRDCNPGRRIVDCGNRVDAGDPRQVLGSRLIERATSILQGGGQTCRTDLVEAIQERKSRAIVNPAEASADDGFVVLTKNLLEQASAKTGRIGEGDSRGPIGFFKGVEARAVVLRPAEVRPAQSVGQCEVWFDAPGVLPVELVGVEPIVALHRSALGQHIAVLVQVIVGDDVRDHAVQSQQRAVIGRRRQRLR